MTIKIKGTHLKKYIRNILLVILLSISQCLTAQETVVAGQVLNKSDKSPLSSVNIYFKNTGTGVQSNDEGYFLIRTYGKQTTLVFSSVGFKEREIHIKPGQSVGIQMEMDEDNTLLQEVFVLPGSNPALDLLKKVRLQKNRNDLSSHPDFKMTSKEQNLVMLSKINQRSTNKKIYEQLKTGAINSSDSGLVVPLYMAEKSFQYSNGNVLQLSENIFSSPKTGEKIVEKLVGDIDSKLNFYNNSVVVFGKSMISPLANIGNAYYNYYLSDSSKTEHTKIYEIHFRSRNPKNLAFDGCLWIDSTSLALTGIEAELPAAANINFIHNLRISENFSPQEGNIWSLQSEDMTLNMNYELLADSLHPKPEIFIRKSSVFQQDNSTIKNPDYFAKSEYSEATLDEKLKDLNNTPLLRTAKWIADVMFTGYMQVGKIDIGKVEKIIRITDIEGLRLTLPFKTNERLWKNISLGGSLGYGFKNKEIKYSGLAQFRLPGDKRRILELNYTNDYRRIDYNYNDFLFRENPLVTGDEDISSSVFALRSAGKISDRREYSVVFSNEWNKDIETNVFLRFNQLFANEWLPMQSGSTTYNSLTQQSATVSTRFSFDEKTYDDHMQRIYIANFKPAIYATLELGKYQLGNENGSYAKVIGSMKQRVRLDFGQLNYIAEAGIILGNVPYPLLRIPPGSETGGYSGYQFNMMNYMEYAADKYVNLHSELMLNGLIFNQIPLIKYLNLREMFSVHMAYGSLNESHRSVLEYPVFMNPLSKPYMEVGVGLTNLLNIFTLQSVWRLTDLNHPGINPWGIRACLNLSF